MTAFCFICSLNSNASKDNISPLDVYIESVSPRKRVLLVCLNPHQGLCLWLLSSSGRFVPQCLVCFIQSESSTSALSSAGRPAAGQSLHLLTFQPPNNVPCLDLWWVHSKKKIFKNDCKYTWHHTLRTKDFWLHFILRCPCYSVIIDISTE